MLLAAFAHADRPDVKAATTYDILLNFPRSPDAFALIIAVIKYVVFAEIAFVPPAFAILNLYWPRMMNCPTQSVLRRSSCLAEKLSITPSSAGQGTLCAGKSQSRARSESEGRVSRWVDSSTACSSYAAHVFYALPKVNNETIRRRSRSCDRAIQANSIIEHKIPRGQFRFV